jgi:hypothetical protein
MRAPLIAHIHVPKTAGTSFRSMLEDQFGPDHANLYVDDTFFVYSDSEIESFVSARPRLRSLSSHFIRTYPPRIAGREVLYVTFLRNPVEQFISYLTYTKKFHTKIPDQGLLSSLPERAWEMPLREIARWVLSHPGVPFNENYLVNYFAQHHYKHIAGAAGEQEYRSARLAIAQRILASFFFTGITERMDESVRRFQTMGANYGIDVPAGAVQVENVSREFRDDLQWINPDDEVGARLIASVAEDQKLYNWAVARFDNRPSATKSGRQGTVVKDFSFTTQVFWRFDGGSFSEAQSVMRNWAVGPEADRYLIRLPRFETAPAQIRLDLTDGPALLRLSSLALLSDSGAPLWNLDDRGPGRPLMAGMSITAGAPGTGILVRIEDGDAAMLLPLDAAILEGLTAGAALEIVMGRATQETGPQYAAIADMAQ